MNTKQIERLARRNALIWDLTKKVLRNTNKFDRDDLLNMSSTKLARLVAETTPKKK